MQLSKVEREYIINMVKEYLLALSLAAAQSLALKVLEDYQSLQRLNNNDRK
jgi:hypothetical protein